MIAYNRIVKNIKKAVSIETAFLRASCGAPLNIES